MRKFVDARVVRRALTRLAIPATLLLGGCGWKANYANLNVHYAENGALTTRSVAQSKANAVAEKEVTWVQLNRLCLTEVASWVGEPDIAVGVTVAPATPPATPSKGVVKFEQARDHECLQFRDRHVVDPFVVQRTGGYRIAIDLVELPSKESQLLATFTSNVVAPAVLAMSGPTPAANVGNALFDTFIKPQLTESKKHVHYEQDFSIVDVDRDDAVAGQWWQRGTVVLLPARGTTYDVNGERKTYDIPLSQVYLARDGYLRQGNPAAQRDTDPVFTGAPYAVLSVRSTTRGFDEADKRVSEALREAARAVKSLHDGVASQQETRAKLATFRSTIGRNADSLTPWALTLFDDVAYALGAATDALAPATTENQRAALIQRARARLQAAQTVTPGTRGATLTEAERFVVNDTIKTITGTNAKQIAKAETDLTLLRKKMEDVAAVNASSPKPGSKPSTKELLELFAKREQLSNEIGEAERRLEMLKE